MPLPEMHGRTHCPKGSDPTLPTIQGVSDGDVLTVDAAEQCGISWQAPGAASVVPIEWIYLTSFTNWAASPTVLDFSEAGGSYDTVTPTFALNAGSLRINKAGNYDFHVYVLNVANDGSGTVWTHVSIEFDKAAGPSASGPHGWVTGSNYQWLKTTYWPNQPLSGNEGDPHLHTFANWDDGTFVGTPFELEVTALKYWDGIATTEGDAVVRLLCTRLGNPFA
jgi:hypothetical protein